ncbi:hypothetical protein [Asticcacaulis benevestitus]|uniref:hypothetical protein n=1 Tax=Asticcacaulis benevestitus TaxID=347481 RepID=UPI0003AAFC3E|nr:hypothetical protein [Asticcacaulis benevestitus]
MPHTIDKHELSFWDYLGRILTTRREKQWGVCAVDHEGPNGDSGKSRTPISGYSNGRNLAGGACRIEGSLRFFQRQCAAGVFIERIACSGNASGERQSVHQEPRLIRNGIGRGPGH